jgi:hypothetical protein
MRRLPSSPDTLGVVLAGGLATRLGPLGLQLNKALVPAGQQPLLAHQLRLFLHLGVPRVVVMTRTEWKRQLDLVRQRCFTVETLQVDVIDEKRPGGPARALAAVSECFPGYRHLLVFLADTYVAPDDLPAGCEDWIGVAEATTARRWCVSDGGRFADRWAEPGSIVAMGAYGFDREVLGRAAAAAHDDREGLAGMLNRYVEERGLAVVRMPSWRDLGDLDSLASTCGEMLRGRPHNSLTLTASGTVRKQGRGEDFRAEIGFFRRLDRGRASFFPRVARVDRHSYELDYVDLPTLAHLYLYWPALATQWCDVLGTVVDALAARFWPLRRPPSDQVMRARCERLYVGKLRERFAAWDDPVAVHDRLRLNGERLVAGQRLVDALTARLQSLSGTAVPAFLHGDLNFANILYSITSRAFKLLDPRGAWGGVGSAGDLRYDLAKLRYSYHGLFNAICDGLFDLEVDNDRITFALGPKRDCETASCDEVIRRHADVEEIRLIEAALLLAAPPLHSDDREQQLALYVRGVQLANEALS